MSLVFVQGSLFILAQGHEPLFIPEQGYEPCVCV